MFDFLIYLGESALCLVALYLLYKVSMSYETLHKFNRVLLFGVVGLSMVLPMCRITLVEEVTVEAAEPMEEFSIMEFVEQVPQMIEVYDYVGLLKRVAAVVFLLGVVFMVARLVISTLSVWRIINGGEQQQLEDGITLTVVDRLPTPFSWFGHIVIARSDMGFVRDVILTHEMAHIRLRHSWDVLVIDLLLCLWWFNPAMWLLRRELQSLHEYQADEEVLNSGIDAQTYQLLLIKRAVGARLHSVANCLNHSNLKNRITMMCKKTSSRWSAAKALLVLPMVAAALAATATTVYVPREVQDKVTENSVNEQNVVGNENNYPMTKSELRRYLMQNLQNKQNLVGLIYADVKVLPDGKVVMVKVAPASGEKDGMQPLVNEVERVLGNAKITERKPAQEVAYRFEISFGSQENGELVWSRVKASDDAITVVKWAEVGEVSTKIKSQKSEENEPKQNKKASAEEAPVAEEKERVATVDFALKEDVVTADEVVVATSADKEKKEKKSKSKGEQEEILVISQQSNGDCFHNGEFIGSPRDVEKLSKFLEQYKGNTIKVQLHPESPMISSVLLYMLRNMSMNVIAEYKYDKSSRDQNEAEAGIKEFLSEQLKRRLNNVECMTGVVTVNAKVARTGMVSIENMSVVSTNGVGMALAKRVEQSIKQAPFVNVQGLNESLPLTLEVVFAKKGLDGKVDTDVAPEKISADAVWVIGEETAPSNAVVVEKQTAGEKILLSRSDMLVIIDGKEGKIDDITQDDVESFRVLNREEATKLFGEKGKNGAVLFNTKLFYENERTESAENSEEDTPLSR